MKKRFVLSHHWVMRNVCCLLHFLKTLNTIRHKVPVLYTFTPPFRFESVLKFSYSFPTYFDSRHLFCFENMLESQRLARHGLPLSRHLAQIRNGRQRKFKRKFLPAFS